MKEYKLTQEQKDQIIADYRNNVAEINKYLSDKNKIKLDVDSVKAQLNDPHKVRLYLKAQELQEADRKREAAEKELSPQMEEFKVKDQVYGLDRTIKFALKPGDTEYDKAYNKAVMEQYYKAPEYVLKKHYRSVIGSNSDELFDAAKADDYENELIDFYEQNVQLCNDAFNMEHALLKQDKIIVEPLKTYGAVLKSSYELYGIPHSIVNNVKKDSFFSIPTVNADQFAEMYANGISQNNKDLYAKVTEKANYDQSKEELVKPLQQMAKKVYNHIDKYDRDPLRGFVAYDVNNNKPVSLVNAVANDTLNAPNSGIVLKKLTNEEIDAISYNVTTDINDNKKVDVEFPKEPEPTTKEERIAEMEQFAMEFYIEQKKLPALERDKMSMDYMMQKTKPGFIKGLFTKDSKEWKNFEYMYKAYNNPNHVYYKNSTELRSAAQDYLLYKGMVGPIDSLKEYKGRDFDKVLLAYSIDQNLDDRDVVEEIHIDNGVQVNKEQVIINPEELNDGLNAQSKTVDEIQNAVDLSAEMDELNKSL